MKKQGFKVFRDWMSDCVQRFRVSYLRCAGVEVGIDSFISFGAWIDVARGTVRIGNNCEITKGCKILSHSAVENRLHPGSPSTGGETVIEDNVFIGMNAIILPNITIGKYSIVGAGAVVTKDVPPFSVVAGNPAWVIKRFNPSSNSWCRATDPEGPRAL